MKCKICGKTVKSRNTGSILYPVKHLNPETKDFCHGFFEEHVKEMKNG